MADIRQKQFTVDRIAHAMISEYMSFDNPFDENYYGEIAFNENYDDEEFHQFIIDNNPELTKKIIKSMPGDFTDWEDCVQYAPNIKNCSDFCGFERDVLDMWINYFFIKPELMNIAGQIAQDINPDADSDIIKMMIDYKGGITPQFSTKSEGPLGGMHIVFTGKSEYFIGDDMEDFLRKNGAKTSHTVSKNTDLLVIGTKPSQNKINKANELGIDIMEEWQLYFRNANTLKDMPEEVRARI